MCHDSFMLIWHTQASEQNTTLLHSSMCAMTHSYVPWRIYMCPDSFIWHVMHLYVSWLIHIWRAMTHSYVTHMCVTRLINMTHTGSWLCFTHACVPWLIHIWRAMTHSQGMCHICMCHDSFIWYDTHMLLNRALNSSFKITGLFCKRALQKRLYSAKETCNFQEPTNHSHPIA